VSEVVIGESCSPGRGCSEPRGDHAGVGLQAGNVIGKFVSRLLGRELAMAA